MLIVCVRLFQSMIRSRRLSIGGGPAGPDLLTPVKEESKENIKSSSKLPEQLQQLETDSSCDEYSKAALVIQERFRAKKQRKLSNITERKHSEAIANMTSESQ